MDRILSGGVMKGNTTFTSALAAASLISFFFLTPVSVQSAYSQERPQHQDREHQRTKVRATKHVHVRHWGHDNIGHFGRRDVDIWRGGHWVHGHNHGRIGWWWVVAGIWYFYPQPVYPYPNPYIPSTIVVTPSAPAASAPAPAPMEYWYYCKSANAYYPYVASCPENWVRVPATPPPSSSTTTPPPPG